MVYSLLILLHARLTVAFSGKEPFFGWIEDNSISEKTAEIEPMEVPALPTAWQCFIFVKELRGPKRALFPSNR